MAMRSVPADFRAGLRDVAPIVLSVFPYGLVVGAAGVAAGCSVAQATGLSLLVNAGASQLAVMDLLGSGAPLAVAVVTALVINARMLMYSASIAPYFQDEPVGWRAVAAFIMIDPAYALSIIRFDDDADVDPLMYYLGVGTPLLPAWVLSTAVGAVAGSMVPGWLPLDFAVPMVFLALVVSAVEDRPGAAAAATGAAVAVVGAGLPLNLGLLSGGLIGVAAGMVAEGGAVP
jgi:predicted branched-subunit amino acid permease